MEVLSWDVWLKLLAEIDAPTGWTTCRFPTWQAPNRCVLVFGMARGDFGIWPRKFPVNELGDDGDLLGCKDVGLWAVCHLPSGLGLGVFSSRRAALISCDAADATGIDWRSLRPNDRGTWADVFDRLATARAFAGLTVDQRRYIQQSKLEGQASDETPVHIWEFNLELAFAGKPERLS